MAKPLTTEDVGGYLHELLQSLKEEVTSDGHSTVTDKADANSDPAEYVQSLIDALDLESDDAQASDLGSALTIDGDNFPTFDPLVNELEAFPTWDSVPKDYLADDYVADPADENVADEDPVDEDPAVDRDESAESMITKKHESSSTEQPLGAFDNLIAAPLANTDASHLVAIDPDVDASVQDFENPQFEEPLRGSLPNDASDAMKTIRYPRTFAELVPRPTGNADAIAQLREVANLTTADALNSFRCKQLIGKAYTAMCCIMLFAGTALLASLFGVNTPGIARSTALICVALTAVSTGVYLGMTFALNGNASVQAAAKGLSQKKSG
jgi:hypothetical protein